MHQQVLSVAILVGLLSLAAVACGGGGDQEAPAAAAPAAAPPAETTNGETPVSVDLSQEGDTVDLTVHITENITPIGRVEGEDFKPSEMTFKVGQAVNFTLVPPPESKLTHSFTVLALGINKLVKFGNPTTFTFTFDKSGTFNFLSTLQGYVVDKVRMKGTITVVE